MGPGKPPLGDLRLRPRRPQAHKGDADQNADQRAAAQRPRPILKRAFGLQDQPARAEQAVAEDQGDASEQRKRCKAVERAAREVASFRLKALNERAEDNALREGAKDGAVVEGAIPEGPMLGVAIAELERNATENERQQHDGDREINRRDDDRKSERES